MLSKTVLSTVALIVAALSSAPVSAAPISPWPDTIAKSTTSPVVTVADRHHEQGRVVQHGHRSSHSVQVVRPHRSHHVAPSVHGHGRVQVHADRHAPQHGHQRRHH